MREENSEGLYSIVDKLESHRQHLMMSSDVALPKFSENKNWYFRNGFALLVIVVGGFGSASEYLKPSYLEGDRLFSFSSDFYGKATLNLVVNVILGTCGWGAQALQAIYIMTALFQDVKAAVGISPDEKVLRGFGPDTAWWRQFGVEMLLTIIMTIASAIPNYYIAKQSSAKLWEWIAIGTLNIPVNFIGNRILIHLLLSHVSNCCAGPAKRQLLSSKKSVENRLCAVRDQVYQLLPDEVSRISALSMSDLIKDKITSQEEQSPSSHGAMVWLGRIALALFTGVIVAAQSGYTTDTWRIASPLGRTLQVLATFLTGFSLSGLAVLSGSEMGEALTNKVPAITKIAMPRLHRLLTLPVIGLGMLSGSALGYINYSNFSSGAPNPVLSWSAGLAVMLEAAGWLSDGVVSSYFALELAGVLLTQVALNSSDDAMRKRVALHQSLDQMQKLFHHMPARTFNELLQDDEVRASINALQTGGNNEQAPLLIREP